MFLPARHEGCIRPELLGRSSAELINKNADFRVYSILFPSELD